MAKNWNPVVTKKPKEYEIFVANVLKPFLKKPDSLEKLFVRSLKDMDFRLKEKIKNAPLPKSALDTKWEGASGCLHQIDAAFSNEDIVLLVECKLYSKYIKVSDIAFFLIRLIDISEIEKERSGRIVLGLIVTTQGLGEDKFCCESLRNHFIKKGYFIDWQLLAVNQRGEYFG
jgi:hypothetical protein